ncbi:hypothetical protein ACFY05_35540 [Microtetraspora fusca]|uniref:Uncharacterized protein n=1 Tax=Microtetraspora fusca TaxID=1997 RepID=A0ABW6VFL2_MICFU
MNALVAEVRVGVGAGVGGLLFGGLDLGRRAALGLLQPAGQLGEHRGELGQGGTGLFSERGGGDQVRGDGRALPLAAFSHHRRSNSADSSLVVPGRAPSASAEAGALHKRVGV